jgi:hemolysin activation/secretion protein
VLDCDPSLAVLRFEGNTSWRSTSDVVAARSVLSWGIDALGATRARSWSSPDALFVSWLGQAQWVHLLPEALGSSQLLARLDVQLAADPLLSIEKLAVGGAHSVRGYRENQVVRDSGVVASIESRIPLWREPLGRPQLELVPFSDVGTAWDVAGGAPDETLVSVGIGVRVSPWRWLYGAFYWGVPLRNADHDGEGLQRHGLHFEVGAHVP